MRTSLDRFEDNLNDSYDKINFLFLSLIGTSPHAENVSEDYAHGLAKVLDGVLDDLKSAKEIFENSNFKEYIEEKSKEVEEIKKES